LIKERKAGAEGGITYKGARKMCLIGKNKPEMCHLENAPKEALEAFEKAKK
jgi:hypothetical protein